jgi:hypothetical protein
MFNPFGPFGRSSPTHCFKWDFSQTVSGKISQKWTKWGKHSQIENACGIFLPMGKIIRMGRKSHHLMERVYAHLSKNGSRKSGFLADPELTVILLLIMLLTHICYTL